MLLSQRVASQLSGKRAQLVSGRHGFDSLRSLNLFAQTSFLQFTSEHHCFPWVDSFKKIWMGRAIWTGSASKSVCILFCFFYYSISRSVAKQLSKSCDMLWYLGAKVSKGWSLNSWQPIQSKFTWKHCYFSVKSLNHMLLCSVNGK